MNKCKLCYTIESIIIYFRSKLINNVQAIYRDNLLAHCYSSCSTVAGMVFFFFFL